MASSRYTHAVVSRVPEIYAKDFTDEHAPLNLDEARKQHAALVGAVRNLGLDVLELPPDESDSASVFTQDLAVVVNGIALMCRPAASPTSSLRNHSNHNSHNNHNSAAKKLSPKRLMGGGKKSSSPSTPTIRQIEVDTMRAVLKKELNQCIVDPRWSPTALLCGADVLFTGREFFVGLSEHTNMEGAVAVASTWPEYPCTPIKIDGPYNLKYFISMAGPDVLCVGTSGAAQVVLKRVEREASYRYQTLSLPEDGAANCLFVNGSLIHRSREEAPKSEAVFSAKVDHPRTSVSLTEFAKAKPARPVSSLFLLLRKSKHVKRL